MALAVAVMYRLGVGTLVPMAAGKGDGGVPLPTP